MQINPSFQIMSRFICFSILYSNCELYFDLLLLLKLFYKLFYKYAKVYYFLPLIERLFFPLEKFSCKKSQRGDQRIFFGLNSQIFLKIVSFGPPFEISIEFRQKSLKNYDFCWKKNFKQNFGDFAKNCPLNPMSLPPLARGTLRNPHY
jgi:hypothetical protein